MRAPLALAFVAALSPPSRAGADARLPNDSPFTPAWVRRCEGMGIPSPSFRGHEVIACLSRFDRDTGRYLGPGPAVDQPIEAESSRALSPNRRWTVTPGPDGTVQVFRTGTPTPLASVSLPGRARTGVLAVSDDAALVAIAREDDRVLVARRAGTSYEVVATIPGYAHVLAFEPGGHRLFATQGEAFALYDQAPHAPAPPIPELRWDPPRSFIRAVREGETLTFPGLGGEFASEEGLVAAWATRDGMAQVRVTVSPREELAAFRSTDAWARAVLERYGREADEEERHVEVAPSGERSIRFHGHGDGCDPVEWFVRIAERGPVVVKVAIEIPAGDGPRLPLRAWQRAFFAF